MSEKKQTFFGHPIGLAILFFTEMWERFSYYGMRALLVLYIASTVENGGLGWTESEALALYGSYTMLVYLLGVPGGWIADRFLGQKKTVMIGGLLLCAGHGVLALESIWAFYAGLALIVLGVGGLKPNISTMVGGLYEKGDAKRDQGFTLFYIGINTGAFLGALLVGYVGEKISWHLGFGLAGIGMLLGQIVFVWGQKYLKNVGNLVVVERNDSGEATALTSQEKDRMLVLIISYLIVVIFWAAFEQAGGLMNLYASEKIDRFVGSFEIPASMFQSVNSFFIMTFGTIVGSYWLARQNSGKESSALFKMAVGTVIMGLGFLMMAGASVEASSEPFGKGALHWLILAYWLHTMGELCLSPASLSFITKLSPARYVASMMGLYWAFVGFGNKLAGEIGKASRAEPIKIELVGTKKSLADFQEVLKAIDQDKEFKLRASVYMESGELQVVELKTKKDLAPFFRMDEEHREQLEEEVTEILTEEQPRLHATLRLEKDAEAKKIEKNQGDGKNYSGTILVEEVQNKRELNIFLFITILSVGCGMLLIIFLKKLKRLTHGAEEVKSDH